MEDVDIVERGGDLFGRIVMDGESLDFTLELIELRVAVGVFGQDIQDRQLELHGIPRQQ